MTTAAFDETKLKDLFKSALLEVLEERRDLICVPIEEATEDIALARAIEEGEHGKRISRQRIFDVLEGRQ